MINRIKTHRNYGIDLLRSFSMLLIICDHILMQGGVLKAESPGTLGYYFTSSLYTICICAVNCFVLISGYNLCNKKFRLSRVLELWIIVVFWSVAISFAFFILAPETRSLKEAISMWLPLLRRRYWFFTAYFIMYLFSPVLNYLICTLDKRKLKLIIFTALFIFGLFPIFSLGFDSLNLNGGACFPWLMVVYLIGGYIRLYHAETKWKNWVNLVVVLSLVLLNLLWKILIELATLNIFKSAMYGDLFLTNTSPIIICEAIFMFLYFRNLNFSEKSFGVNVIEWCSPLVFSVYLIHAHPMLFWNNTVVGAFSPLAEINPFLAILEIIGISLAVFIMCILLDYIRYIIFKILKINTLSSRIGNRIESVVNRLIIKVDR